MTLVDTTPISDRHRDHVSKREDSPDTQDRARPQVPSSAPMYEHEEEARIPARGIYTEQARQERLDFLRDHSGTSLDHLQETALDPQKLTGNIENFIGAVEVPVGLAGPLLFNGQHAQGNFYAPMATSEGR